MKEKLTENEQRLESFQTVLQPACESLVSLNEQLEEEQKNRHDAELLAKQVQTVNLKLKRQSQFLLQKLASSSSPSSCIDIDINGGDCEVLEDDSIEKLLADVETERNLLLTKLDRQKSESTANVDALENKNKELTKKLLASVEKNEELQNLINSFRRTSTLAIQEFSKLQDQMQEEVLKKETAEKFALDCSAREKALHHQSVLLINSGSSDDKILKLLAQIEDLSKELTEEKENHKKAVAAMEEKLKASKDMERTSSLETQLEIANSQVERLHKSVMDLEKWKEEATQEMTELRQRCEEVSLPLPPQPPPPPPPCPPPPPSLPTNTKIPEKQMSRRPSNLTTTASLAEPSNQDKLLSDLKNMMSKIQKGDKLQSSKSLEYRKKDKELPPALMELQSVLAKMKTKDTVENQSSVTPTVHIRPKAPAPTTAKPRGVYKVISSK